MNGTYEVYLITESWSSSTATWENLATSIGQNPVATINYTKGTTGWFDFDVTDATGDLVANPSDNYGFMILIDFELNSYTNGHISKIHSSESSEESLQPKMVIEYTATPIITNNATMNNSTMPITYNKSGNLFVSVRMDGKYSLMFHTGNGRLIDKINNKYLSAGIHTIECNNLNLPKGIVFISLKNGSQSVIFKAVIY
jgi:hypothetical protein